MIVPRGCSLGAPGLQPTGAGASLWSAAESAGRAQVYLPITEHTGGQTLSVLWCMVLDPTAPTQALLSISGPRIIALGGHKQRTSYSTMLLVSCSSLCGPLGQGA